MKEAGRRGAAHSCSGTVVTGLGPDAPGGGAWEMKTGLEPVEKGFTPGRGNRHLFNRKWWLFEGFLSQTELRMV